MGRLTFLIGLARSGKSTISNKWLNNEIDILRGEYKYKCLSCESCRPPRVVLCRDDLRLACGSLFNTYLEGYIAACAQTTARALLLRHDVLLDETHTTRGSILQAFELDIDANWYFVNTPPEVCKERAICTGQEDLLPVIDRMFENLWCLTHAENHNMDEVAADIYETIEGLRRVAIRNKEQIELRRIITDNQRKSNESSCDN